jgi:hypothetical protein
MLSTQDKERLQAAQHAVDMAQQSLSTLYQAEDQLLAEHALDMLESIAKMNQKLKRLLIVTK